MSIDDLLRQTHVLERELMDGETAHHLERLISRMAAVQRYRVVRKYVYGVVVDGACGCGFGSTMLAGCPSVEQVHGFDISGSAIDYARVQHPHPNVAFNLSDLSSAEYGEELRSLKPDCIVSIETAEHIPDLEGYMRNILESGASRFIVSYPNFITSTFNPYHVRDITKYEMERLVGHPPVKCIILDDAVDILVFDL